MAQAPVAARSMALDAMFAVVLCGAAAAEVTLSGFEISAVAFIAAVLLTTLPLAFRSAAPVAVTAVTTGGWSAAVVTGFPSDDPIVARLAPLVAVYSLGAHASGRKLAVGVMAVSAAYALAIAGGANPGALLAILVPGAALALGTGIAVRMMGFESEELEAKAALLEIERDEAAEAAVATERTRIARELHDIIGHSVSVMGVQAGAVRRRLTPDQDRELEMLLGVERVGRDAIAEMKDLLSLLRERGDDQAAPAPSLERIVDLVEEMRAAGMDIDLRIETEIEDLPPGRAAAAFRILQEALTNAIKHAPGSRVTATLGSSSSGIKIVVVNDGPAGASPMASAGHGLIGMRERVALYGGSVHAGPRQPGGFAVEAHIPLQAP